ncbi:MAG: DedA family protein [bacterium]|nr:DedA family protein [bacterium]
METLFHVKDIILHLNKYLPGIILNYGSWTYGILFAVIFCETGLVVTPFLPGDSLLFATGTLTTPNPYGAHLNLGVALVLLSAAAILGDAANYAIGYFFGSRLLARKNSRLFKKEYIDRTHAFYEKYGKMTIILARFVPIVRTFAPFLAGMGRMRYFEFATYNVVGGVAWISLFLLAGHFFGNLAFVQKNFSTVILAIIIISILPIVFEYLKHRYSAKIDSTKANECTTPGCCGGAAEPAESSNVHSDR